MKYNPTVVILLFGITTVSSSADGTWLRKFRSLYEDGLQVSKDDGSQHASNLSSVGFVILFCALHMIFVVRFL